MEKNKKHIDDLFKEKLGGYTETPPPAAWDALEKSLNGMPDAGRRTGYRRLGYLGLLLLGTVLSVSVARVLSGSADKAAVTPGQNPVAMVQDAAPVAITPKNRNTTQPAETKPTTNTENNLTTETPKTTTANTVTTETPKTTTTNNVKTETSETTTTNNQPAPATPIKQATASTTHTKQPGVAKTTPHSTARQQQAVVVPQAGTSTKTSGSTAMATATNNNHTSDNPSNDAENEPVVLNSAPRLSNFKGVPGADTKSQSISKEQAALKATATDQPELPEQPKISKPRPIFDRFEAGVKAGFEAWANSDAARKYLVSPYIQYNLSPKFAIMLQPAVKYATVYTVNIGDPKSYINAHGDSNTTAIQAGAPVPVYPVTGGTTPSLYITPYAYKQSHDTVVKSNTFGGTYTEYELPILLKYKLTKTFALYGGVNINYSKLTTITEHTLTSPSIGISDTANVVSSTKTNQAPLPTSAVITYAGNSYSTYTAPEFANQHGGGIIRLGYMLGFSYEFTHRWLFDVLAQKTDAKSATIGGYDVNGPLASTYFRFTIGYKLISK